jgi:pilus assembly protein CpaB
MAALKIKNSGKKTRKFKFNKNWIMLIIALVVGGFGVHAANAFIQEKLKSYKESHTSKEKMVKLVVAKTDLPKGIRISAGDLSIRKVPVNYAHKGAVTPDKYTIAINQKLTYSLAAGRPLLWAHLENGTNRTFAGQLAEGMRALSITVDTINSISGFLKPKDKIDLMLTYKDHYKRKITRPVIQNLLVLATDSQTQVENSGNEGGNHSYSTLTVEVTPEDAKRIILAQEAGKITAVLRSPDDKKILAKKGMRISQLFSSKKKNGKKIKKSYSGIEYIIGGN